MVYQPYPTPPLIRLRFLFLIVWLSCTNKTTASGIEIAFNCTASRLEDGGYWTMVGTDTIFMNTLRFYTTDLKLVSGDKVVYTDSVAHLIDLTNPEGLHSFNVTMEKAPDFDAISFELGIDSTSNCSGALAGDLDPMHGMYWSWQSGYINLKAEGSVGSLKSYNTEIQYHIGGYLYPFLAAKKVELQTKSSNRIRVCFDLNRFLKATLSSGENHIMSPGTKAVSLSQAAVNAFMICQP